MTQDDETRLLTVIADSIRNLPKSEGLSSRTGDGGCSSAMTVKG
jgi:hypothetical protein